jgi:hypothetical protein
MPPSVECRGSRHHRQHPHGTRTALVRHRGAVAAAAKNRGRWNKPGTNPVCVPVRPAKVLGLVLVILVIGFAARPRSHPPRDYVDRSAGLSSRAPVPAPVMSTMRSACFDCHSNETRWPWYSKMPLVSSLIERDVTAGRGQINFSHWARYNAFDRADMLDKICDVASSRRMPPRPYRMLHSEARLSDADVAALCAWSREEATRLIEEGS